MEFLSTADFPKEDLSALTKFQIVTRAKEIFSEIEVGPEEYVEKTKAFLPMLENTSEKAFLKKWTSYILELKKNPFFGSHYIFIKFFFLTRKLRIISHRIETVIPHLPHPRSVNSLYRKILEFLVSVVQNSPINYNVCQLLLSYVEEIEGFRHDINIGPPSVTKFARITEVFDIIREMKTFLVRIQNLLIFTHQLNEIINCFNYLFQSDDERLLPFPLRVPLNFDPQFGAYDKTAIPTMSRIGPEEKKIFNDFINFLDENRLHLSDDDGFNFSEETIVTPSILGIFHPFYSLYKKIAKSEFSENFHKIVNHLMLEPIPEKYLFEALCEITHIIAEKEFLNDERKETDLFQNLVDMRNFMKTIHYLYMFLLSLDACGVFPFRNTISVIYFKSQIISLTQCDMFNSPLLQPLQMDSFIKLVKDIEHTPQYIAKNSIKLIRMNIRTYFCSTLSYIIDKYSLSKTSRAQEELLLILKFMFQVETATVDPEILRPIYQITSSMDSFEDFTKLIYQYIETYQKSRTETNGVDFLHHFISSILNTEQEEIFPYSNILIHIFCEAINLCVCEKTIRVFPYGNDLGEFFTPMPGEDESIPQFSLKTKELFHVNNLEEFTKRFNEFNTCFMLTTETLHAAVNRVTTIAATEGNSHILESLYCIDLVSKGSLSSLTLQRFLDISLIGRKKELSRAVNYYIHVWRFLTLRDEIARILACLHSGNTQNYSFSSLRHYNMKSFLTSFSSSILYLTVTFGINQPQLNGEIQPPSVDIKPQEEELVQKGIEECIHLKKLASLIPISMQANQQLVSDIDSSMQKLTKLLYSLNTQRIAEKIKALANSDDPLRQNGLQQLFQAVDQIVQSSGYNVEDFTTAIKYGQEYYSTDGELGQPSFENLISYINTLSLYSHTIKSLASYNIFLLAPSSYVQIVDPLLIIARMPDNYAAPLVSLQVGLAPENIDFGYFCYISSKISADIIAEDNEFIPSFEIRAPEEQQSLEVQNKISQILEKEVSLPKQKREGQEDDVVELAEEEQKIENEIKELNYIKLRIKEEEERSEELAKALHQIKKQGKESLKTIRLKYSQLLNVSNEDSLDFTIDIESHKSDMIPLAEKVQRKRIFANKLREKLRSLQQANEIFTSEEQYSNSIIPPEPTEELLLSNDVLHPYVKPCRTTPIETNENNEEVDQASPPPKEVPQTPFLPLPILSEKNYPSPIPQPRIPTAPSTREPRSRKWMFQNLENENTPMYSKQAMTPAPDSLRELIGDQWPEETKLSVQKTVSALQTTVGDDARSFLESLHPNDEESH